MKLRDPPYPPFASRPRHTTDSTILDPPRSDFAAWVLLAAGGEARQRLAARARGAFVWRPRLPRLVHAARARLLATARLLGATRRYGGATAGARAGVALDCPSCIYIVLFSHVVAFRLYKRTTVCAGQLWRCKAHAIGAAISPRESLTNA